MENFLNGVLPTEEELNLYNQIQSSNKIKIVKIGAKWCGPCLIASPILKKFESENPEVEYFDFDLGDKGETKFRHIVQKYRISGIPRFFVLDEEGNILVNEKQENMHSVHDTIDFVKEILNVKKVDN